MGGIIFLPKKCLNICFLCQISVLCLQVPFPGHRKVPALFSAVVLCRWHCVVSASAPPPPFLSRSVCLSLSWRFGELSCVRRGSRGVCSPRLRGLRASPVGCNFALLDRDAGDSAWDFLWQALFEHSVKVGKERMGGSCDGAGPAPSPALSLSHPVPSGGGDAPDLGAVISASHPHHLPCDQQLAVCCRDLYPRFCCHQLYQSKLTAAGDKEHNAMCGLLRRSS